VTWALAVVMIDKQKMNTKTPINDLRSIQSVFRAAN
jgi:hypothetical protein